MGCGCTDGYSFLKPEYAQPGCYQFNAPVCSSIKSPKQW